MFVITAEDAQDMYAEDSFIQGMIAVNQAITAAAPSSHECKVTLETGDTNPAYKIKLRLERYGFFVMVIHNSEDHTSEITVRWGSVISRFERIR